MIRRVFLITSELIINIVFILVLLFACILIFVETKKIKKKEKDTNNHTSSRPSAPIPEMLSHFISGLVDLTLSVYGQDYSVYQINILWYGLLFSTYDLLKDHSLYSDTLDYYIKETASQYFSTHETEKVQKALKGVFDDLTVCFCDFTIDRLIDNKDIVFEINHKNAFCKLVLDIAFDGKYGDETFISYRRSFLKLYEPLSKVLESTGYHGISDSKITQNSNIRICISSIDDDDPKDKRK